MKYIEVENDEYGLRGKYSNECPKCKKEHIVFTQPDQHPEYYTDVYIECVCNELIRFVLPVN